MGQLDGKVAVITGAASGMGKAAARLFSSEGANVVLADLNVKGGEESAKAASEAGQKCVFQRTDVSEEADVAAMIDRAVREFGRLDVVFNNAGIGGATGPLEFISVDDWDKSQAVLLRGVFLGIKHAIEPMRKQGGGAIVSTASVAGFDGFPGLHAYCAAKAGVINLTRSAALELAADKIRVNCIAPGGVNTPILGGASHFNKEAQDAALERMQPLPRAGQPEDIAQAALWLSSEASRFVTGHCMVVDGGLTAGQRAPRQREGAEPVVRLNSRFAGPSFET